MPVVLAHDEDRRLDDGTGSSRARTASRAGRASGSGSGPRRASSISSRGDVERDARAVHDREVGRRTRRRARRSRGRGPRSCSRRSGRSAARSSCSRTTSVRRLGHPDRARGAALLASPAWRRRGDPRRHLRLVVPVLAAGLLPGGHAARTTSCGFYAERFDTVELNTTGYRLPAEEQFERWADAVPDGFRFAPKLALARLDRVGALRRAGRARSATGSGRSGSSSRARATTACSPSCSARSTRRSSSPSTSATSRGRASTGVVAVNDFAAEPFRYIRLREPPYSDDDLRALAATPARARRTSTSATRTSRPRPPTRRGCSSCSAAATAWVTGGGDGPRRRLRVDEDRRDEQHRDPDDALAGDAAADPGEEPVARAARARGRTRKWWTPPQASDDRDERDLHEQHLRRSSASRDRAGAAARTIAR